MTNFNFKFLGAWLVIVASITGLQAQNDSTLKGKDEMVPAGVWNDVNGEYINAHGGGILLFDSKYYWFGEHRPAKGFSTEVGVTCYSSADLCNWKYEGVPLSVSEEAGNEIEKGCIIERPKVIYNEKTKKFVMWFHLELKGKGYAAARAGVAVSDSPAGPYRFVSSSRVCPGVFPLNMKGGQMSRDMTLYVDDDGKAYHIYSSEENLTLQIAELTDDYQGHSGKYIRLFPGGHNEAPALFKHDGTYWMITSGCTGWEPNEARLFSASSIWGPWKQHLHPFIGKGAEKTFGGQSTFVISTLENRFVFMADVWKPESLMYSKYIWLPIGFDDTGKPVIEWKESWNPC